MKILLAVLLLVSFNSKAQFILTSNGLTIQNEKEYFVLEFDKQSQKELYERALQYLHSKYNSPKDVLSIIEEKSITINAKSLKSIRRNKLHVFNMNYSITILFKDGKVRFDKPTFRLTTNSSAGYQVLKVKSNNSLNGSTLGIYNTKNKLKSELAKNDLELFFNAFISDLKSQLKKKDDSW
jgi:hypothetical protein